MPKAKSNMGRPHQCWCGKAFLHKKTYLYHLNRSHGVEQSPHLGRPYQCHCGQAFKQLKDYVLHLRQDHGDRVQR